MERCVVSVSGSSIVVKNKNGLRNVPIASIQCLMIGNGVSITSDAAALCAKHNCYIAFVKGGTNVHSIWHAGRYSDPKTLVRQVEIHSNPELRLNAAKFLLHKRQEFYEDCLKIDYNRIQASQSIQELLGLEGSHTRKVYAYLSMGSFKRDQLSHIGVNSSITIGNNALYSFVSSILLNMGLSPSVGILHGQTRRGGMAFDIADIYKYPLVTKPCFEHSIEIDASVILRNMSKQLSKNRKKLVKSIIFTIEELLWS